MAWLRSTVTTKLLHPLIRFQFNTVRVRFKCDSPEWTSQCVRATFLDYFQQRGHQYVHSSSILPKKGEGSYFINAGMNQFKPIFLGTVEKCNLLASYETVVNSQKCIRVGGKHNDLETVGQDTYHHTFFEMLGSWSFGQYFKKEACLMAWDLLTNIYKLPQDRLYVSYFAGDETLGLSPDIECYKIWKDLGVMEDHILKFSSIDNFWDMGETGPCGPCTEIHYDYVGNRNASDLVNSGSQEVVELWNLVFMTYDRQSDGSLKALNSHHVDTGMGLERLCAVLQGSDSNYNTDLFLPIFNAIHQKGAYAGYTNQFGLNDKDGTDMAYRIVADHCRMITVAIADGLLPGRNNLDSKLKQVMERCIYQATEVLKCEQGTVSSLVPLVIQSLGNAFPEIRNKEEIIKNVIDQVEKHYMDSIRSGSVMFNKALKKYGNIATLTGEQIWEIQDGHFGKPVPLEIIKDLASSNNIVFDHEGFQVMLSEYKEKTRRQKRDDILSPYHIAELQANNVDKTDDCFKYDYTSSTSGYSFNEVNAVVTGLIKDGNLLDSVEAGGTCGVITDKTGFYSEGGGQVADTGYIDSSQGASIRVEDVQKEKGYVVHFGKIQHGTLCTGDKVKLSVDPDERFACMCNHTATHIIQYALKKCLTSVEQAGSEVSPNKLTFHFRSPKGINKKQLEQVSLIVNELIRQNQPVYKEELPLNIAQTINVLVTLADEVYPQIVQVVSIGESVSSLLASSDSLTVPDCSVELCGGTHVEKTGDLEHLVISQVQGISQGTQKIVAITSKMAAQAARDGNQILNEMNTLKSWIKDDLHKDKWLDTATEIQQSLYNISVIPSTVRNSVQAELEQLNKRYIGALRNELIKQQCLEHFTKASDSTSPEDVLVIDLKVKRAKDANSMILSSELSPIGPLLVFVSLLDNKKDTYLVYLLIPKSAHLLFNLGNFGEEVCERCMEIRDQKSLQHEKLSNISNFIHSFVLQGEKEKLSFIEIVKEIYFECIS